MQINAQIKRSPGATSISARPRRGTAEIELLLVIPILLGFLFLVGGAMKLGAFRIENIFSAEEKAYRDATASQDPLYSPNGPAPIDGITSIKPGLPNRMPRADFAEGGSVDLYLGSTQPPPVPLHDNAAFAAPAWSYSTWPVN